MTRAPSRALPAPEGFALHPCALGEKAQLALLAAALEAAQAAPFFRPSMPRTGTPLVNEMTNCGPLGWVADRNGYRYEPLHPGTGRPWPPIPPLLLDLWARHAGYAAPPEACLMILYRGAQARLGLHVDADEADGTAPVLTVSLGDDALFRLGGPSRGGPTRSWRLASGTLVVLAGAARRCFHGIDRIYPGTSALLPGGGRLALTLRRVTVAVP